jgi:hypothetical protein
MKPKKREETKFYKEIIMKKRNLSLLFLSSVVTLLAQDSNINPFAVNNGAIPSKNEYSGSLFKFNYNYPKEYKKPINTPWSKVLNNKPLTKQNAYDYIIALKKYIEPSMKTFVLNQNKWNNSSQKGWYSMLWAGEDVSLTGWEGRESIYGTYTGQIQPASVYKDYGLTVPLRNYAAIYYDQTAAYTLYKIFKNCSEIKKECIPSIENNEAQFEEGAIIIKAAVASATPEQWPVLDGAAKWQIYRKPFDLNGTIEDKPATVTDTRVIIFDIIVKDSIAAPQTGWVFTTLVYDKNAKGENPWDKMVPLGAMWGNDPKIDSAKNPKEELMETYINPNAPDYAKVTLGYGLRLSGPFDIAVKYNVKVDDKTVESLRSSSCLSCHGTSSYKANDYNMVTFFYPVKSINDEVWNMYKPGSNEWNEWFQNRWGDKAQSKENGVIALDYSTFLEQVMMNYTANYSQRNQLHNEEFFKQWRKYKKDSRKH